MLALNRTETSSLKSNVKKIGVDPGEIDFILWPKVLKDHGYHMYVTEKLVRPSCLPQSTRVCLLCTMGSDHRDCFLELCPTSIQSFPFRRMTYFDHLRQLQTNHFPEHRANKNSIHLRILISVRSNFRRWVSIGDDLDPPGFRTIVSVCVLIQVEGSPVKNRRTYNDGLFPLHRCRITHAGESLMFADDDDE